MKNYLQMLHEIVSEGERFPNRTGIDAISVFGKKLSFDLRKGFPLVTTKKVFFRGVIEELLWILRGETNIKSLNEKGVHIWDEWADRDGDLGPVYGKQWRNFSGVDQIEALVESLLTNPRSRRHVVSGWNPEFIPGDVLTPQENVSYGLMALAPCHMVFQCYIGKDEDGGRLLDMQVYMRSVDSFLGIPFNIAIYAALTHILAFVCRAKPGNLHMVLGDTHIYENHLPQIAEQLSRVPRKLPTLKFYPEAMFRSNDVGGFIENLSFEDFVLTEYDPYPALPGEVAV
jgi:thymidylate synthase